MKTPLCFEPIGKVRVWGGQMLAQRSAGDVREPIGESWEIADHDEDTSICMSEPYVGKSLSQLMKDHAEELCGQALDAANPEIFPLMLKLIDPVQDLSVQVHPDDEYAGKHKAGELGKTEAWYVLDAEEGSKIYCGLKDGVDKEKFAAALKDGTVADVLHSFEAKVGDVVYIKSGTIHALGAGVRIAEIQQNSDTTYRVFDWNRVGLDGQPRELHVEHALNVSEFKSADDEKSEPERMATLDCTHDQHICCDKFCFDTLDEFSGIPVTMDTYGESFHILTVVKGTAEISCGGKTAVCGRWDSCLVPAGAETYIIKADETAKLLMFYVPEKS